MSEVDKKLVDKLTQVALERAEFFKKEEPKKVEPVVVERRKF